MEHIITALSSLPNTHTQSTYAHTAAVWSATPTHIVRDVWCGAGRCFPLLQDALPWLDYTGIDFSPSFVELARQEYPAATFVCQDMISFLQAQPSQSSNAIIGVASIQHLPTHLDRARFFVESYRTLAYWGSLILVNRSFSEWFFSTYTWPFVEALLYRAWSLWQKHWNDLSIPRKGPDHQRNGQTFARFYHIFTLRELRSYALQAGFTIEELCLVDTTWAKTHQMRHARNSFLVARKMPIKAPPVTAFPWA